MATCAAASHWDARFMQMARLVSTFSKDPRKQVGAVLVSPDCRNVYFGYNGPPSGFDDHTLGIMDRAQKNKYSLHAETNALAKAATDVAGWTIYVTAPPCLHCAMTVHQAGIARVVTPNLDPESQWFSEQREAEDFLSAMGVTQGRYDGE
jgi:dCMP deaminase